MNNPKKKKSVELLENEYSKGFQMTESEPDENYWYYVEKIVSKIFQMKDKK